MGGKNREGFDRVLSVQVAYISYVNVIVGEVSKTGTNEAIPIVLFFISKLNSMLD
jgi:hypothetical protein